jgi:DNA-binding NtrC family response regulator
MVRAAQGGTLFLDEVGELSLNAQAKLLRTLQEKAVRPVGGERALPVDIRIVGATNRDLEREMRAGRFREDLFFRLNVVPIHLPPLRERTEDLPLLAAHFAARFSTGFVPPKPIDDAALAILMAYPWPGNVRELETALRRALALGREDTITPADLPEALAGGGKEGSHAGAGMPGDDCLAAYEKAAIANALRKTRGNRKAAAALLGIGEATLYRKLKSYHLR